MKRGGEIGEASEAGGHGASSEEYGGGMKKQKSIKLNLNKAAGVTKANAAMMRKSSDLNDLNKDTFRGQESQDHHGIS
jgi:hypothetical protein